jgi:hypothetical protein
MNQTNEFVPLIEGVDYKFRDDMVSSDTYGLTPIEICENGLVFIFAHLSEDKESETLIWRKVIIDNPNDAEFDPDFAGRILVSILTNDLTETPNNESRKNNYQESGSK